MVRSNLDKLFFALNKVLFIVTFNKVILSKMIPLKFKMILLNSAGEVKMLYFFGTK